MTDLTRELFWVRRGYYRGRQEVLAYLASDAVYERIRKTILEMPGPLMAADIALAVQEILRDEAARGS